MTWYFDAEGDTIQTVEWEDTTGNVTTAATNIQFNGSWNPPVPEQAREAAVDWIIDQAAEGNTQTAITALAEIPDERWTEGSPS